MRFPALLPFAFCALAPVAQLHAQKSYGLTISAPATVARGTPFTITATLKDAWDNQVIVGRLVTFSVGGESYLTSAGSFPTNSAGHASRSWTFGSFQYQPGRYRIVVNVPDGYGYLAQRTTVFIQVT